MNLYWLFLRTEGPRASHTSCLREEDTAQALPERHLDKFFKSLPANYRSYEGRCRSRRQGDR